MGKLIFFLLGGAAGYASSDARRFPACGLWGRES